VPKEVGHAAGACHFDPTERKVCALVFQARVGTRQGFGGRGAAPAGKRTVTAVLWVMGPSQERHFRNYHWVLNRAWRSSLVMARVLPEMVVQSFAPTRVVVPAWFGLYSLVTRLAHGLLKAEWVRCWL
jgi:hypothetical protein